MGAALFIVFTELYTASPSAGRAQLVGHITFTLSFVVVIVRGRLAGDRARVRGGGARPRGQRRTRRCGS